MAKPLVDLTLLYLHETDAALLVTEDDENRIWLPKSQIEFEMKDKGLVLVTMPEWLAKEKGLI